MPAIITPRKLSKETLDILFREVENCNQRTKFRESLIKEHKSQTYIEGKRQFYSHIWKKEPVFLSNSSPKSAKTLGGR